MASWAVLSPPLGGGAYNAQGAVASTPTKKQPAWGAAGLASDGLSTEERELQEALEASRRAAAAAAAAVASEEERQLAAAQEASRIAEEARQQEEFDAKVAMDVSIAVTYHTFYAELGGEVGITQPVAMLTACTVYCCDACFYLFFHHHFIFFGLFYFIF